MGEILCFCFGKHGEKKAEKSNKIAQSLLGDAPQVYLEFGVKAGFNLFGKRPAKAGVIMIG